jgi:hypothetical protein
VKQVFSAIECPGFFIGGAKTTNAAARDVTGGANGKMKIPIFLP